jgi:hypothetical protein
MLSACLAYSLTLNVEVVCSETSVNFCQAYVRCKVLTVVSVKCTIFWYVMLYTTLEIQEHFRGMYWSATLVLKSKAKH